MYLNRERITIMHVYSHTKKVITVFFTSLFFLFSCTTILLAKKQKRECPKEYIKKALAVFSAKKGKTIVEIGSMRDPVPHPVDNGFCKNCIQGHSTMWWALTGMDVYSVDINPENTNIVNTICKNFKHVHAITQDGIAFLKEFKQPIDLLFLDAWDADEGTPFAEKHLEAYMAAKPNLHSQSLILIDDTDLKDCGKGRLVIPQAIQDGYKVIFTGRQTLLAQ